MGLLLQLSGPREGNTRKIGTLAKQEQGPGIFVSS